MLSALSAFLLYACRTDIRVRTKLDSQKEEFRASLAALFSASRQMTAVVQAAAVEKGLPWRTVPEVTVMLGDGRREKSTKLFFIEIKAYRSVQATKEPEPILRAAYGVKDLTRAAEAAPELPLLRHRFINSRPALTMGVLSQKGGPIELVIARDYKQHWPRLIDTSCFTTDKLFLMKTVFHPGQLLCGQADPDAVGTKMKGVKRRLTLGTGESAGSSTSSSRQPRAATPAADSPERRRRDSPSPIRREREKKKRAKDPSSRSSSAASSDAQLQREVSVPGRRDKEDASIKEKDRKDKSVKRREKESPVRRAPAKKKRARKMSTSSSSDGLSNSSSEDEATAEVKIIDKSEEEQLRVLKNQREARREKRKELREAVREHGAENLLQRARAFTAAQREAEGKAEAVRAKQQGEEAEAEPSEADQAATEETERGEKEGSTERFVRRRTTKEELEESAPPAAGETSAAAEEEVQQVRKKGKPAPSGLVERANLPRQRPERPARRR